ncbi:hypothetical protein [Anabaena azotica]|uniref:Uncharacterized protein n=1 Tax=Anabaena azotica FACHB-119 TaxID=947527 RepID=A0ABR8CZB0_9NOST|nr:hypothetical protein [Anabaena azotica]MBD2499310.1 hypothetical protein [Anabaena azotica FACHB-119]
MEVNYKRIVSPILMGLVVVGAMSYKPVAAFSLAAREDVRLAKSTPKIVAQNQGVYRSDRYKFRFTYPQDFVIDRNITTPSNGVGAPLATIDIWTKQHAQKIRAGAYEGGTEYPPNVNVRVYNNPKNLPLQNWVKQSNQFSQTRDFRTARIAGGTGIKFQSDGLYANENVVFVNPRDSRIIVIAFSKIGGSHDVIYRRAYQQVINSFAFVNR